MHSVGELFEDLLSWFPLNFCTHLIFARGNMVFTSKLSVVLLSCILPAWIFSSSLRSNGVPGSSTNAVSRGNLGMKPFGLFPLLQSSNTLCWMAVFKLWTASYKNKQGGVQHEVKRVAKFQYGDLAQGA